VTRLPLLAATVLSAVSAAAQAPSPSPSGPPSPPPKPCLTMPESRQLDFWIGDWDVSPTGKPVPPKPSRSRIELSDDGCVVNETYTTRPGGYTGRSLNAYDANQRRWEQFYVDNAGGVFLYLGHARDGNMYFEADFPPPGKTEPAKQKMTFFAQGHDQVRQLGEQSTDGGKTWTVTYDLTYRRRPQP
jgi:hypothetical protein